METGEDKIKMTVVGHDENNSDSSYMETETINTRVLDPSSSIRAERYPIPSSFDFRSHQFERNLHASFASAL